MARRKAKLGDLVIDKVALCHAGANQHAEVVFFKAAELPASDGMLPDSQCSSDVVPDDTVEKAMSPDQMQRRMEALETKMAEMMEMMSMKKSEEEAPASEEAVEETETTAGEIIAEAEVEATAEPEMELVAASAEVEDVEKADLRKSLEAAQAEIAKMKRDARHAEYVAKAKTDLDNLGDAAELGALLLDAADNLAADQYQLLERTLKAANAQIGSGDLFKQLSDQSATPVEAKQRIDTLAQEMVDKGEALNLGLAKMEVVKRNPELRDEYYSATERA